MTSVAPADEPARTTDRRIRRHRDAPEHAHRVVGHRLEAASTVIGEYGSVKGDGLAAPWPTQSVQLRITSGTLSRGRSRLPGQTLRFRRLVVSMVCTASLTVT